MACTNASAAIDTDIWIHFVRTWRHPISVCILEQHGTGIWSYRSVIRIAGTSCAARDHEKSYDNSVVAMCRHLRDSRGSVTTTSSVHRSHGCTLEAQT